MVGEPNAPAPAILIVDDHPVNLRLYRAILKDSGAEIVATTSSDEALDACRTRNFAMVLLDVQLDRTSGFELAHRLRDSADGTPAPIVFISAVHVHEQDAFRGYRLGAVDYLMSPVVPEILRAKAAVFIRLQRLRDAAAAQGAAMERAWRELRSAHTELEHFSWSVSHDLRTPLAQIAGLAELLTRRTMVQQDEKAMRYVGHMQEAARRMTHLIDDLLDLAGLARAELRAEPVDMSALAREVAAELSESEPQREVHWSLAEGLQAQGDPRLLRTALSNLIGNAWKYSAAVPGARIEVGRVEEGANDAFFVRDNGAGFDVQAAGERLFRPFQRFHAEQVFPGNGIGLAIVQRVVSKHGGRVWVESAPGQGASFFFTLPVEPGAAEAKEAAS